MRGWWGLLYHIQLYQAYFRPITSTNINLSAWNKENATPVLYHNSFINPSKKYWSEGDGVTYSSNIEIVPPPILNKKQNKDINDQPQVKYIISTL